MQELRSAFDRYDKDLSGKIDIKELNQLLSSELGIHLSKTKLKKLIKTVDADDSKSIDFEEFAAIYKRY
jgi:Ca2+-binding EF-hand superfamily protein